MPSIEPGPDDEAAEAVRAWIYGTLGASFDSLPVTLDWQDPAGGGYAGTRAAIRALCREFLAQARAAMQAEQVRCFVNAPGGVPAPPYASYYLDGQLLGPCCNWVGAQYRAQGLELDLQAGQPPDFLSVEFEFLYFLCRHQRAARLTGETRAYSSAARAEADFFSGHVALWLPRFADHLVRATHGRGFFGLAAQVLAAFCSEEQARLVDRSRHLAVPDARLAQGPALGAR